MILELYAIKDTKVAYNTPFAMHNEQEARRAFSAAIMDKSTEWARFPADYELWRIGLYDDKTGMIQPDQSYIMSGNDVRQEA